MLMVAVFVSFIVWVYTVRPCISVMIMLLNSELPVLICIVPLDGLGDIFMIISGFILLTDVCPYVWK